MNFEKIKSKKQLILLILTLTMFLGISFGAVFFIYDASHKKTNVLETGLISIEFTEGEAINLASIVPVIDEIGLEFDPYEFSVTNTSSIPIKMNIQFIEDEGNTLPIEAVRYGLVVDDELVQKGSLSKLDEQGNFVTYENFAPGKTINCKLMLWVDYYYTSSRETFSGKIKVIGESSDAFNDPIYISLATKDYPNNIITLASGASKTLNLSLFNNAKQDVLYKIYYTVNSGEGEIIGTNTTDNLNGTMNTSKAMELTIVNPTDETLTIQLGVKGAIDGLINLEEGQKEITFDSEGPIITSISDAGEGRITFTVSDSGSGVSKYCVNQSEEDTTNCNWITAVEGEQTTDVVAEENGDYYVHVKDLAGNIGHSIVVEIILISPAGAFAEEKYGTGGLIAVNTSGTLYNGSGTIREYRYSGATVNNYLFFDTDGDSVKDTNEIWRIVGIFRNSSDEWNLKIMRNTTLTNDELPSTYTYNGKNYTIKDNGNIVFWNKSGTTGNNDWTTAGLQYWLNDSNGYLGTLANRAQTLIDLDYTYYLGNVFNQQDTTITSYTSERGTKVCASSIKKNTHTNNCNVWYGNKTIWKGGIALMYPSDYGYTVDSSYWSKVILSNFYYDGAMDTSWMYKTARANEWTISPSSYLSDTVIGIDFDGIYILDSVDSYGFSIHPCLNLLSTAEIDTNHQGTEADPYIILE